MSVNCIKSIYGLKQVLRAWFEQFTRYLIGLGFSGTHNDPHYFFKHSTNSITILLVYVDDIVRTGTDGDLINRLISQLYSVFEIKDLGSLNHFLGIEVSRDSRSLFLSQTNMLETFLHGLICCTVSHMAQMQLPRQVLLFLPLLWPIYPNTEV